MNTRTTRVLLLCSLMLGVVLAVGQSPSSVAAPVAPQAGQWEISTIGYVTEGEITGVTAIDLDSTGLHQVAYYRWSGGRVFLARENHAGWTTEQVNITATTRPALDMVITADDFTMVTHHDNNLNLVYTQCYADNCTGTQLPVPSGKHAGQESLTLDSNGHATIGFGVSGGLLLMGGKLYSGTFDPADGIWKIGSVGASGLLSKGVALALDDQDYPALAYLIDDTMVVDVKYAAYDGTQWVFEKVTEQEEGALALSGQALDLDDQGDPVISYIDGEGQVRLTQRSSGGGSPWNSQLVDNGPATGRTALAYESGNKALVVFTGDGLKVASKGGGGGWGTVTVDPQGLLGADLVMDSFGYPHISYYAGDASVRLAVYAVREIDLQPAEASVNAFAGSDVTFALQLTNMGNVLDTYDISADNPWRTAVPDLSEVTLAPGEAKELLVRVAVPTSAAGGESDLTEVTVTSRARASVTARAELTTAVLPGEWLVSNAGAAVEGMNPALALYPDDRPLISSVDQANTLRQTLLGAGGWQDLPVLAGSDAQVNTEVRIGSDGLPAIAFVAAEGRAVEVAQRDSGGAWNTVAVPGSQNVHDLGLALDSNGFPHLAFSDWDPWYAFRDPAGWHGHSMPDSYSYYRAATALDSQDNAHAAFYYGFYFTGVIVYWRQEGDDWVATQIDIGGDNELFDMAIAVDQDDKPVIAYSDPASKTGLLRLKQGQWRNSWLAEGDIAYGIGLDTLGGRTAVCFQQDGPRYAEVCPHGWAVTPVSDQPGTGCSLALSADGRPQLVYRDTTTAAIHYATLGSAGLELAGLRPVSGLPGNSVAHRLWLTNTGTVPDSFALAVNGDWPATVADGIGPLAPGESVRVAVVVDIPAAAELGEVALHTLEVTSTMDADLAATAELVTRAAQPILYLPAVVR